jgi:3-mercaptopyruvate sulfurtransferase SseA
VRLFSRPNRVDATRAAELLERGAVVVLDVRENVEWKAGRIPGALHIPLAQVPFRGSSCWRWRRLNSRPTRSGPAPGTSPPRSS